jgi:hypothetical protein
VPPARAPAFLDVGEGGHRAQPVGAARRAPRSR